MLRLASSKSNAKSIENLSGRQAQNPLAHPVQTTLLRFFLKCATLPSQDRYKLSAGI
jgi:hypothetical protein